MNNLNYKRLWVKARRFLNAGWKVALIVIGAFILIIFVDEACELYGDHYGRSAHYWDRFLSEDISVHYFNSNTVRVYNLKTKKYVTPKLKWVADTPARDSLTVFCDMNGKRGFLNVNTGEITIQGKYEHAWVFSEGLAAVVEPNGKMGFIDRTGKTVIAPEIDYFASHDYVFKHNVCCISAKNGNKGLLNREGKWVLPQEYQYIEYVEEVDMFIPVKDNKDGLIKNGSFEWVYPVEYDDISWIDAPTGKGFVLYKDFRSQHVSVDGTVIDSFLIDASQELEYVTSLSPEEANEYTVSDEVIAFRVYSLWGMMDKHTGKVLIPAKYGNIEMASKNIIKCSLESAQYDDCVLYDLKGRKIE